ncbi:hypothetical protein HYQ46_000687 [Verticillium longisporum]|nr:hypothetical protein HYQ46_000687 [Verticillium longisporum]
MTITEVGCMGVKPGLSITDPSTPEGAVLPSVWKTVVTKPGGPQRIFWGLEEEDSSKVWAFFDWNSVQEHVDFAKTHGAEAVEDIPKVCTHGEFTKHITLLPSTDALGWPITRIIASYFPSDILADEKDKRIQHVKGLLSGDNVNDPDSIPWSYGWGLEKDYPVRGLGGKTGTIFVVLVGAQTSDQHNTLFGELVHAVKSMDGLVGFHQFAMRSLRQERE